MVGRYFMELGRVLFVLLMTYREGLDSSGTYIPVPVSFYAVCAHTHTHTRPQQRTGAFSNSRGLWWRCNTLHIRLHLVSAQLHRAPSHRTQAFTVHRSRTQGPRVRGGRARVDPRDRRPPPALRGSTVELVRVYIVYGGQSRRGASGARARGRSRRDVGGRDREDRGQERGESTVL